jgi:hypothetical protein
MARRWRGIGGAAITLVAALGFLATRSPDARGVTAAASNWGTFAHLATGDLGATADRQAVAQRYDVIALRGNLTSDILSDLHARRSGIVLLAYEKAAGLNNAEVDALTRDHPDWIAHDRNGDVIHPQSVADTTLGDLTNADFRVWQASKMADEVRLGADGAFIDTLGAYFPDNFYSNRPYVGGVAITDAAWRDGSVDLITKVKLATGRMVIANGFGLGTGAAYASAAADADRLIGAADGVQIESFTRSGNAAADQYITADKWDQDLAFLELLGARGKIALAYTKVKTAASPAQLTALRDYGVGSFLLAFAPGRSYYGFDDGAPIPSVASDVAWARGLGSPTGARTRSGTDGWSRPFQGGTLSVRVANPPVVSGGPSATTTTVPARLSATFTGTGGERQGFPLTVGSGPVTVTGTFGGGSSRSLMIFNGNGTLAAGPVSGASPVVLDKTIAAGKYVFAIQGPNTAPFTMRVDYANPVSGGSTTTTATTAPPTTTTTRPPGPTTTTVRPTTTTVAPTTTTTALPGGRQTAMFTGTGSARSSYPLKVGAGPVTATATFADGYKSVMIFAPNGSIAGGPLTGQSPVVLNTTLAAGTYSFAIQGPSAASFTLRVDYTAPATTISSLRPFGVPLPVAVPVALVAAFVALMLLAPAAPPFRRRRRTP